MCDKCHKKTGQMSQNNATKSGHLSVFNATKKGRVTGYSTVTVTAQHSSI